MTITLPSGVDGYHLGKRPFQEVTVSRLDKAAAALTKVDRTAGDPPHILPSQTGLLLYAIAQTLLDNAERRRPYPRRRPPLREEDKLDVVTRGLVAERYGTDTP